MFKLNLPLMLTLGGMIILGITTTILGFVFWDVPERDVPPPPASWMQPNFPPGVEPDRFPPMRLDAGAAPTITPSSQDAGPEE